MRETLLMAIVGIVIGVPYTLGLTRLVASRLFRVQAWDPITMAVAMLTVGGVAALAGYLPVVPHASIPWWLSAVSSRHIQDLYRSAL